MEEGREEGVWAHEAGRGRHCLDRMAAGMEEEEQGGRHIQAAWQARPMRHCPPPEAAVVPQAAGWFPAGWKLLPLPPQEVLLGALGREREAGGLEFSPGLVSGEGTVGDQGPPNWTCPEIRFLAHLRAPMT